MQPLESLRVSLTKNGYQKVWAIVKQHPSRNIVENLTGVHEGINLSTSQVVSMLSGNQRTLKIPHVWDEVRKLPDREIKHLVFISIIFSHHKLIRVLRDSATGGMRGRLTRGNILGAKEYTNFAYAMQSYDLLTRPYGSFADYDFTPIVTNEKIGALAKKIIEMKLRQLSKSEFDFYKLSGKLNFHKVLSISETQYRKWLSGSESEKVTTAQTDSTVEEFFFRAGHRVRKKKTISHTAGKESVVDLRHNVIQQGVYTYLANQYGKANVKTEHETGFGGSIDVVVRKKQGLAFYEIKTARTVRLCVY